MSCNTHAMTPQKRKLILFFRTGDTMANILRFNQCPRSIIANIVISTEYIYSKIKWRYLIMNIATVLYLLVF